MNYPYLFDPGIKNMVVWLWTRYFKLPIDTLDTNWPTTRADLRKFFFSCSLVKVYDFLEALVTYCPHPKMNEMFKNICDAVLTEELSGYRFVGNEITPITSTTEIKEIEEALSTPLGFVTTHLESALTLLSDRTNPDHRNSIKESISAVESLCKSITGKKNATLGECLNTIETRIGPIHGALKRSLDSLYGYTSSESGIRHGLSDEPTVGFDESKFMLVTCSAFINYLVSKVSSAGINLQQL
jgi:hypothetical protein